LTPSAMKARMRYLGLFVVSLVLALHVVQLVFPGGGVGFVTGLVVFLITWWMVLFMVLPRQIRSQLEAGEVVKGSEPGAPVNPRLREKIWLTTQIACGLWLVYFVIFEFSLIDFNALPGPQYSAGG